MSHPPSLPVLAIASTSSSSYSQPLTLEEDSEEFVQESPTSVTSTSPFPPIPIPLPLPHPHPAHDEDEESQPRAREESASVVPDSDPEEEEDSDKTEPLPVEEMRDGDLEESEVERERSRSRVSESPLVVVERGEQEQEQEVVVKMEVDEEEEPPVRVKEEEEDGDADSESQAGSAFVDVMSLGGEHDQDDYSQAEVETEGMSTKDEGGLESPYEEELLHQQLSKSKKSRKPLSAAQRKANKVKGGKARAQQVALQRALLGLPSHTTDSASPSASSPGPSGAASPIPTGETSTREGSPDLLPHQQISSTISSGRNSPQSFPFPFAFPVQSVDTYTAKKTVVPLGVGLGTAFVAYEPPGVLGGRGYQDDEDEEGERVEKRGGGKKGKGRMKDVGKEEREEEEEEGDDRLYCVCRQLYDPDRTMIACDMCENWYHLDCINIDDEKIDLVDQFICPVCQKTSTERTTWKSACARPTCLRAVAPLSKYCSDYCGISVAATRLELSGIPPEKFWNRVVGARRREAEVVDVKISFLNGNVNGRGRGRESGGREEEDADDEDDDEEGEREKKMRYQEAEDERALKNLQGKLSQVVAKRQVLDEKMGLVNERLRYLRISIKRWEILCQGMQDALIAEGIGSKGDGTESGANNKSGGAGGGGGASKKSKQKKKAGVTTIAATSLPDANCGFDVRLVMNSEDWAEWVGSDQGRLVLTNEDEVEMTDEHMNNVCLRPKKKCERHAGWQKVRQADFEVEFAVMTRRLERLSDHERRIRLQIEDHEEASRFRAQNRGRTGSALSVEEIMQASPQTTPQKKKSRAVGGFAGGAVVNGVATSQTALKEKEKEKEKEVKGGGVGDVVEDYEVPEELFAFLSRSELKKLAASRR